MQTYKPKNRDNEVVVRFTRRQLEDALEALEKSGAQEIGIPLETCDEQRTLY